MSVGAEGQVVDRLGVPLEGEGLLAGRRVPDLYRRIRTGGGEPAAVGAVRQAESHAGGRSGAFLEDDGLPTGRRVPQLDRPGPAGGGKPPAVGAVRQAVDRALIIAEG